jgi:hypothetical protein
MPWEVAPGNSTPPGRLGHLLNSRAQRRRPGALPRSAQVTMDPALIVTGSTRESRGPTCPRLPARSPADGDHRPGPPPALGSARRRHRQGRVGPRAGSTRRQRSHPLADPRPSPLSGGPYAAIRDTDFTAADGDTVWDRAVGPMQFIPRRRGGRTRSTETAMESPTRATSTTPRWRRPATLCTGDRDLSRIGPPRRDLRLQPFTGVRRHRAGLGEGLRQGWAGHPARVRRRSRPCLRRRQQRRLVQRPAVAAERRPLLRRGQRLPSPRRPARR